MLVEYTGTILQTICKLITSTNPSIIEAIFFILPWTLYVLPGTQACWQLVWGFYSFYWLAFLTQEPLKLKMSLNTSLLILMTISYTQKKNAQLAKFQGIQVFYQLLSSLLDFVVYIF